MSGKSKDVVSKASPHTIKKFELIEEYIKSWAQKLMLNDACNGLIFIDCMCNSGVYTDNSGMLVEGTPVRVSKALLDVARTYTEKMVHIYLNDKEKSRVDELKKHIPQDERNYHVVTSVGDANELLKTIGPQLYQTGHLHYFLLYDPYDASIDWEALLPFFRNWGEVMINHMVSDPVRAITSAKRKTTKEKYENTYLEDLKAKGKYDALVKDVKQFKLATQIFDAFGETVDNYSVHDMLTTTDADIERQFQIADTKLGREGIGMAYGNKYMDMSDFTAFKVDVILFVADEDCMNRLHSYAEARFHGLNDDYRRYIATIDSEKVRRDYDSIVSDGDVVSKHNFRLLETIQVPHESGGKEYRNHLFVSDTTGVAKMKLNSWEAGVIAEEEKREDFVCWIRNPSRASWALCIPYEIDGEVKPTFPDFIIVRKDPMLEYVIDILEPHNADFKDNLGKAKGFAEYARQNPGVGRIQLIRMSKDATGKDRFKRLDMYQTAIRDKVSRAVNTDELDHIFDTDGFFE